VACTAVCKSTTGGIHGCKSTGGGMQFVCMPTCVACRYDPLRGMSVCPLVRHACGSLVWPKQRSAWGVAAWACWPGFPFPAGHLHGGLVLCISWSPSGHLCGGPVLCYAWLPGLFGLLAGCQLLGLIAMLLPGHFLAAHPTCCGGCLLPIMSMPIAAGRRGVYHLPCAWAWLWFSG
jgi:hypothetical protein